MSVLLQERDLPFNEGEIALHKKMKAPGLHNPTSSFLTSNGQYMVSHAPLLGLGILDADGRPWSTVWGGEPGFASVIDRDIVGMRAFVDGNHDPVINALFDDSQNVSHDSVMKIDGRGKLISGVTIDLESRRRVKLHGKVILGTLDDFEAKDPEGTSGLPGKRVHAQLVVKIEESLGNCPKYLHKKHIIPALPEPRLISASPRLPPQALDLLNNADCFFISSFHQNIDMDTNYRGGPAGFVRVISNGPESAVLVYPEYSGNRLYQSLGNLMMNHRAGVIFPNFNTGDALYMTVTTEILFGEEAEALLPRCKLAVKMSVVEARHVEKALGFRGISIDSSPYTPPVRYLRSEKDSTTSGISGSGSTRARLISKQALSPSIARFRFKLLSSGGKIPKYKPSQYAVFSFKDELDMGYSHMRDDDPLSLNDDYIRTFTVSSSPGRNGIPDDEFEITVRKNARVTSHMFQWNTRTELEVPLLGFGGTFKVGKENERSSILPFIAGGIGITPLLGQLPGLDVKRLRLLWSISINDLGAVQDIFQQFAELPVSTTLFVSKSAGEDSESLQHIENSGVTVVRRRMKEADIRKISANTFYLCAGRALQSSVLEWLKGKDVVYEDFNY